MSSTPPQSDRSTAAPARASEPVPTIPAAPAVPTGVTGPAGETVPAGPLPGKVTVRPALVADAKPIMQLVNELALRQVMLPRSPASVIENIRDFVIAEVDGVFAGCGALAITWTDIAEVRSLAVSPAMQKHGIGRTIVDALVEDAKRLGIPRLFAFTYVPGFFAKMGFTICEHEQLPHKVFNDCMHCPKFLACDEIAMTRVLDAKASPSKFFGKPQRAIPLPQRTPAFTAPVIEKPGKAT